ncbi:MAG: YihA family ribosome biogenesis GTP-binding protein [Clostridia bacterium]|nr:YihA family ribosome biogenesis GTP-binding protein [Clostridia bacterium]
MVIKSAEFVTSVADKNYYKSDLNEVAFVGRSNVGKSSLINFIVGRKKLAKTSSMPGKTSLINYFLVNKQFLLVDLPGYGYAEVSKNQKTNWGDFLEEYLKTSEKLKCVYLLLDIRRTPTNQDEQMLNFLYFNRISTKVVVTKIDTLSKAQVSNQLQIICSKLGITRKDIIVTSSQDKEGHKELLDSIEQFVTQE